MARSDELRKQRAGTVINLTSKKQETELGQALLDVEARIQAEFPVRLKHKKDWHLNEILKALRADFEGTDVNFGSTHSKNPLMRPDGGVLSMLDNNDVLYHILISEMKSQGTNDKRIEEGLDTQAMGNAIERMAKNVIGFRTAMLSEMILPFVCFGSGWDFKPESSILDRVLVIAMFGPLNDLDSMWTRGEGRFNRGCYFFREEPWPVGEMADVLFAVAKRSIQYYFSKYGEGRFISPD